MNISAISKTHEQNIHLDDADAVCRYVQLAEDLTTSSPRNDICLAVAALNSCEETRGV